MSKIDVPIEILEQFCSKKPHPEKLSLLGSVLRSDFRQESDIDVLVEFEKNGIPGLLGISRMERELSKSWAAARLILGHPKILANISASRSYRRRRCSMQHDSFACSTCLDAGKDWQTIKY